MDVNPLLAYILSCTDCVSLLKIRSSTPLSRAPIQQLFIAVSLALLMFVTSKCQEKDQVKTLALSTSLAFRHCHEEFFVSSVIPEQ